MRSRASSRLLAAWLVAGCNAAPVELHFASRGTGDRLEGDRVVDASAPAPPAQSSAPSVPELGATGSSGSGSGFAPGPECALFPNDCADRDRPKCTLVSNDPGYRSSCVVARGTLPIGAPCERRVRGDDDCAPGGFCSAIGESFEHDNRLVCKRLCSSSDQCDEAERCLQLLGDGPLGLCVAECPLFDDAGCGADELRCAAAAEAGGSFFAYCEIFGGLGDGEPCTLSSQCRSGLSCELASQSCRYSCDQRHPCPDALRCVALELGNPDAFRLCVP